MPSVSMVAAIGCQCGAASRPENTATTRGPLSLATCQPTLYERARSSIARRTREDHLLDQNCRRNVPDRRRTAVFSAAQGSADPVLVVNVRMMDQRLSVAGGHLRRMYDVAVSRAPTIITADRFADFGFSQLGIYAGSRLNQRADAHNMPEVQCPARAA